MNMVKNVLVLKVADFRVFDYMGFVSSHLQQVIMTYAEAGVDLGPDSVLGQALAGLMLSDGHLDRMSAEGGCRLMLNLGYNPVSISMVCGIMGLLCAVGLATGKVRVSRVFDLRSWEAYPYTRYVLGCTSRRKEVFFALRQLWYPHGEKLVPANIEQYLSPIALAFWLMGDGSRDGNRIKLATHGFSDQCQLLLQRALMNRYGISAHVRQDTGGGKFLIIDSKSSLIFASLVRPYLHPVCTYKLP